jgi:peptidase E
MQIKPIFLLADSQLLFWRGTDKNLLTHLQTLLADKIAEGTTKAAYIGASNGDDPTFYDIFLAAMAGLDINDCRMIPVDLSEADHAYLEEADVVLLAGGSIKRGWAAFEKNGLIGRIVERYYNGAILIGVSAGAVQLGLRGWPDSGTPHEEIFHTFQLVPVVIDVHDEPEWSRLKQVVEKVGHPARGVGISSGGGLILHEDRSLEVLRHAAVEFFAAEDGLKQTLLLPVGPENPQ